MRVTRTHPNSLVGEMLIAEWTQVAVKILSGTETQQPRWKVEMRIRGLMLDPSTNMPIIVLKDVNSDYGAAHLGGRL